MTDDTSSPAIDAMAHLLELTPMSYEEQCGQLVARAYQRIIGLSEDELSEEELVSDRAAIERFRQRLARALQAAESRGHVATRIEWRGYLRKVIGRERALRAELDELRASTTAARLAHLEACNGR